MEDELVTLAMLRRRSGLTQEQLAQRMSVTVGTVSKWERGVIEINLPPRELKKLCEVLNITFEELVQATEHLPLNRAKNHVESAGGS